MKLRKKRIVSRSASVCLNSWISWPSTKTLARCRKSWLSAVSSLSVKLRQLHRSVKSNSGEPAQTTTRRMISCCRLLPTPPSWCTWNSMKATTTRETRSESELSRFSPLTQAWRTALKSIFACRRLRRLSLGVSRGENFKAPGDVEAPSGSAALMLSSTSVQPFIFTSASTKKGTTISTRLPNAARVPSCSRVGLTSSIAFARATASPSWMALLRGSTVDRTRWDRASAFSPMKRGLVSCSSSFWAFSHFSR
mmetsp:Transcript_62968/g.184644  ORF Transcript_62968/g.184644 Transcript_62968/m.184644 type:complete len:252 (-) Transcript_62968:155-910(-)